jgi:DNA-binding MarR family transcriptional regulator
VAGLRERGYLTVAPSPTDGREKVLSLTARAERFLATVQEAGRSVEATLREEAGDEAVDQLFITLDLLARHAGRPRGQGADQTAGWWAMRWHDAEDG